MDTPNWLYENSEVLFHAFVSCFLILALLLAFVRLFGLRSFAKFTPIDFAVTICIGSVLASTIMSDTNSLLKGGMVIATLLLIQSLFGILRIHVGFIKKFFVNDALYLFKDENILTHNLKKARMTHEQLHSKLRVQGHGSYVNIHSIILETTGDISIITKNTSVDPEVFQHVRST